MPYKKSKKFNKYKKKSYKSKYRKKYSRRYKRKRFIRKIWKMIKSGKEIKTYDWSQQITVTNAIGTKNCYINCNLPDYSLAIPQSSISLDNLSEGRKGRQIEVLGYQLRIVITRDPHSQPPEDAVGFRQDTQGVRVAIVRRKQGVTDQWLSLNGGGLIQESTFANPLYVQRPNTITKPCELYTFMHKVPGEVDFKYKSKYKRFPHLTYYTTEGLRMSNICQDSALLYKKTWFQKFKKGSIVSYKSGTNVEQVPLKWKVYQYQFDGTSNLELLSFTARGRIYYMDN